MGIFQALGVSVAAGFFVVIFLKICHVLWLWCFENVYLRITCRHLPDLSGKWTSEYRDQKGNDCYDDIEITQYGHKIVGTMNYRITYHEQGKPEKHKAFRIVGLLRNDMLTAYFWNDDRKQKGSGAFTVSLSREGNDMDGKCTWFDVEANEIVTDDYSLRRH
jgi:hypothetical protein